MQAYEGKITKYLYFDIIMYVFLSFIHIYVVLFKPLLEATGLALSQKADACIYI